MPLSHDRSINTSSVNEYDGISNKNLSKLSSKPKKMPISQLDKNASGSTLQNVAQRYDNVAILQQNLNSNRQSSVESVSG
jgi:hypothetical protein